MADPGGLRHLESFLEMLAAERGAARNTREAYARDLRELAALTKRRGRALHAATHADIRAHLAALDGAGIAASSAARKLSAMRQFFRFLYAEGVRKDDPTAAVDAPKKRAPAPKILAHDEVLRLLAAARALTDDADRARAVCLVELLYASGLRVSELADLPLAAVRGAPAMIRVKGKGGRERLAPLHDGARAALRDYLTVRDRFLSGPAAREGSPWLFPSRGAGGRLTRQRIGQTLKALAVAAGLDPERVSPHVLRHAFATELLAGGANLRTVQTLLGHADIATTQVYTHVLDGPARRLVTERHPLARRKR